MLNTFAKFLLVSTSLSPLLAAVAASLLLPLLVLYTPVSGIFGVRGLTLGEWSRIGAATPAFLGLAVLGTRLTAES